MAQNDLVCGVWPVIEALRAGKNVERLLIRREAGGDGIKEIRQLALDRDIPWQPVPVAKLDRLTKTEHQGVIAYLSQVEEQDLDEVITMAYERGETPLVIALDSVTDVRNLGAIARPKHIHFVTGLPKTRSGKMLRRSIQALAEGRDPGDLTTIDDPSTLEQIKTALGR